MSVFFHIDVNSAFLSWSALEQLESGSQIDLRTIPSSVGGDTNTRHGIVLAKSIPAKAYGIRTAEPVVNAFRKCPNLTMVPPNHTMYQERSRMLMTHLADICPDIEQVSIDECYMDYTPIADKYPSPEAAAAIIKDSVLEHFGFTVNVGISDRKVLAKMASDQIWYIPFTSMRYQISFGPCLFLLCFCAANPVLPLCISWAFGQLGIWPMHSRIFCRLI